MKQIMYLSDGECPYVRIVEERVDGQVAHIHPGNTPTSPTYAPRTAFIEASAEEVEAYLIIHQY
jgi:hypothetical protein